MSGESDNLLLSSSSLSKRVFNEGTVRWISNSLGTSMPSDSEFESLSLSSCSESNDMTKTTVAESISDPSHNDISIDSSDQLIKSSSESEEPTELPPAILLQNS